MEKPEVGRTVILEFFICSLRSSSNIMKNPFNVLLKMEIVVLLASLSLLAPAQNTSISLDDGFRNPPQHGQTTDMVALDQ